MTIRDWIKNREVYGVSTFSVDAVISAFNRDSEPMMQHI